MEKPDAIPQAADSIRRRMACGVALGLFLGVAATLAVLEWGEWQKIAALPQTPDYKADPGPYVFGVLLGYCVPFAWLIFTLLFMALLGAPAGRWVAFGWRVLTLVSVLPLFWHYWQAVGPTEPTIARRQLDVVLGLMAVICLGSLLPRNFRGGLALGLVLAFILLPPLGMMIFALLDRLRWPLAMLGIQLSDFHGWITASLEYALFGGVGLGLLLGILACFGVATITMGIGNSASDGKDRPP